MILIDSIRHLGPLSIIAPVAIGLYNYRFLKLAERLILLYLIIGGAIDAILFLFIEILLSERKTKGRIWQGRFEVMEN